VALDVYKDWLGIAEDIPRPPDHYTLLRLARFDDDVDKIRAHYKKLNAHVRKYATGTYQLESQELLNELAKAMLCLTDPERKRDYDEAQGRTVDEGDEPTNPTMAQSLVRRELLSRDQVKEAKEFADRRGLEFRDALVQMKLVDAETAAELLAMELGLPYVDLDQLTPDDSVLASVPRNLARRNTILPLFVDDDMLLVACVDEPSHELEDDLRFRLGVPMRRVIATPLSINQGIARYYAGIEATEQAGSQKADGTEGQAKKKKKKEKPRKKPAAAADSSEAKAESHQKRQIGIILLCWSVIVPVAIDLMVLPASLKFFSVMDLFLTLVASPILLLLVWKNFFKGR